MNTYRSLLLMAVLSTTLAACGSLEMAGPDNVTPVIPPPTTPPVTGNNKIEGTWNFAGVRVNSIATISESGAKATLYNDYTTFNNKGVMVIDGSTFKITGLSYSIDAVIRNVLYMDGVLVSDMQMPFQMDMDPYNASNPYKLVGADSIYFSAGVMETPSYGGGTTEVQAAGGKISWSGDTLLLTINLNQVQSAAVMSGFEVMKLVKQK
ncbi:putative small lipoprotein YifL [Chitinophaga sp. W2I13]|uniref:hypothetical protein n=1 Tax=Chitinophaga sp. W2I13 TaxID=3373923 RepID=UPI003D221803